VALFGGNKRQSSPDQSSEDGAGNPAAARPATASPLAGDQGQSTTSAQGYHPAQESRTASGFQPPSGGHKVANIGKSIIIKGDLTGDEDLEIEGQVEGRIQLPQNQVTIGANGIIKAEINAKSIVIVGKVTGNLIASERLEIQSSGHVVGDIQAPRLLIQEGAVVNGSVEMTKQVGATATTSTQETSTRKPPPQRGVAATAP
jgi:cytoskeletal protein CcmA (bactofilin family)